MAGERQSVEEIRLLIKELVGDEEFFGIMVNDEQTQVQARVMVNGIPFLQTFERDSPTGKFRLVKEKSLGQLKF